MIKVFKRKEQTSAQDAPQKPQKQRSRRRAKRPGRGALLILSAFLVGSAGLRVSETYGTAQALEGETEEVERAPEIAPPADYDAILEVLSQREARVAEREATLDTRTQALALAEERIDAKLAELEAAEAELRATIALAENASENDLAQLTSVYENMGAEEASALFSEMNPDFAAGFLARMRADSAAAILAGLEPNQAYEISVILAGRNALVPTE